MSMGWGVRIELAFICRYGRRAMVITKSVCLPVYLLVDLIISRKFRWKMF